MFRMKISLLLILAAGALLAGAPLHASLLLQYEMKEGSGLSVADTGANPAANGTLTGSGSGWTTDTPSGTGSAYRVSDDNGSSYITGGTVGKIGALSAFTITTWIKLSDITSGDRLFSTWDSGGGGFLDLRANSNSTAANLNLVLQFSNGESNGNGSASATVGIDATEWVFLALVYNGSTVRYYLGDASTSVATLGSIVTVGSITGINSNSGELRIGSTAATVANRTPDGSFSDFRIYDESLSANDLNAIRMQAIPEPSALVSVSLFGGLLIGLHRLRKLALFSKTK